MGFADESSPIRVVRGLADCGFAFNARDFTEAKRLSNHRRTENFLGWFDVAQKIALPVIKSTLNVDIPDLDGLRIDFEFDGPGFQEVLDKLSRLVDIASFRYVLSQPIVVGVIFDSEAGANSGEVFDGFDSAMDAFRNHTATMSHTKLSVTGILLWCFTKSEDAHNFTLQSQGKLRSRHFWAKLNTVSWCVDMRTGQVSKHKGVPIIIKSVFDTGKFERSLKA